MGVEVTVVNAVTPALAKAAMQIGNLERPLNLCGMVLQRSWVKQFAASGIPAWKPLAPSTAARRRKGSSRPLQDTGRLRRSYTAKNASGNIHEMTRLSLTVGSNLAYAATHQYGGTFTRKTKPGKALMRKTKSGQYRFAKASDKRVTMGVFWSGGREFQVTIPARPLGVQPSDLEAIKQIFIRHVKGALKPK